MSARDEARPIDVGTEEHSADAGTLDHHDAQVDVLGSMCSADARLDDDGTTGEVSDDAPIDDPGTPLQQGPDESQLGDAGTANKYVRNYRYGLLRPTVNASLVEEQMLLAHRYRNKLIEIERDRRGEYRKLMGEQGDIAPLEAEMGELVAKREALVQQRSAVRSRTRGNSEPAAMKAEIKAIGGRMKGLRTKLNEIRARLAKDDAIQAAISEINARAKTRAKEARATCGVYWGTYLIEEAAMDAARKQKNMPEFRRFSGYGRVCAMFQGGRPLSEVWAPTLDPGTTSSGAAQAQGPDPGTTSTTASKAPNTLFYIHKPHPGAWDRDITPRKGERRRAGRTRLALRVGSGEKGRPIWAEWPMIMHRPLPEGCRIKNATVTRAPKGIREVEWFVTIAVELPESIPHRQRKIPEGGKVAINLGWCQRPDGGIRSGYLVGDDGWEQEVTVPPRVISALEKASRIRGYRDDNRNEMIAAFLKWRDSVKCTPPEWFVERTKHIEQWKSFRRLHDLALEWRKNRWEGDSGGFALFDRFPTKEMRTSRDWRSVGWRYRDHHLWRYEDGLRRHALGHRKETYRIIAARLGERYRTLVIDDTDLSLFKRSEVDGKHRPTQIGHQQNLAAPSELRQALTNVYGTRVVTTSSAGGSITCNACGHQNDIDRATPDRHITCSKCEARWDQDANACRNALVRSDAPVVKEAKKLRAARMQEAKGRKKANSAA